MLMKQITINRSHILVPYIFEPFNPALASQNPLKAILIKIFAVVNEKGPTFPKNQRGYFVFVFTQVTNGNVS